MIATVTGSMTLNGKEFTYDVAAVEGRGGGACAYVWITTRADRQVYYGQAESSKEAKIAAYRRIFEDAGVTTPENLDAIESKGTLCAWIMVYGDIEVDEWMRKIIVYNHIDAGKEIAKSAYRVAKFRAEAEGRRAASGTI